MTVKYTFYVGLNDKDSKVQEVNTLEAAKIVQNIFIKNNVDGATITSGKGSVQRQDTAQARPARWAKRLHRKVSYGYRH